MAERRSTKRRRISKTRAAKVRSEWKNPELRVVPDPDKLLCVAMLAEIQGDIERCPLSLQYAVECHASTKAAFCRFATSLQELNRAAKRARRDMLLAGDATAYLARQEEGKLPLDLICDYCGYAPDKIVKALLTPVEGKLAAFLQRQPGSKCPVCHAVTPS